MSRPPGSMRSRGEPSNPLMEEAERLCDRVAILEYRKIIGGTPGRMASPKNSRERFRKVRT
jgi:ABC-type multidrug transport system ATPase subunit